MAKEKKLVQSITSRDEDFAQWYTDVVREAKLCDYSGVKGCLNYLPNGYAIWENIQSDLDKHTAERSRFRRDSVSVRHLRHCSVTCGARRFSLTETFRKYGISGARFFVGRKRQDRSFVQGNSSGRKVIRFMRHMKKRKNVQN